MARRIPASRFDELVRAATAVFIARGYRLTQMADIAEAAGVAKGTLYRYVESKDALLEQCLWHADEPGMIPLPSASADSPGR
ncbi:MAG: helix-turn-helix domain-containing protein [Myxococcota bacterium]